MEELIYSIDWGQVKNSFDIFMWGDPNIPVVKGAWVQIAIAAVGLIMQGASAIKRNRERKLAIEKYKEDKAALEAVAITNPYKGMTNPYEDLTVNQKQAQFLAQQTQQSLANRMQSLRGAAGASGISSLAQSTANERAKNLQGISGMIGQQEAANQRLSAQGQLQTEAMIRQGEQTRQVREEQRKMGIAGMSQYQAAMGQQMYNQAIGGVGQAVGQLGGAIADKMELDKLNKDTDNLTEGLKLPALGNNQNDYNAINAALKTDAALKTTRYGYGSGNEIKKDKNFDPWDIKFPDATSQILGGKSVAITPELPNLYQVSQQYGVSIEDLLDFNPEITDPTRIQMGTILQLTKTK